MWVAPRFGLENDGCSVTFQLLKHPLCWMMNRLNIAYITLMSPLMNPIFLTRFVVQTRIANDVLT
jgi:hypothetical protein